MPVTDITTDQGALTITITARFAAPVQRIWDIYADPRQLEKVWGPPSYPATVVDHALVPGGRITYYMTGPEGDRHSGCMDILKVDEPTWFHFRDGFADEDFTPDASLPTAVSTSTFTPDGEDGQSTLAVYVTTYPSLDGLRTVLDMGVEEGSRTAIDQIDELLLG
ncbi:SRPBCC family protein [Brachybacterium sp. DNPG3]